MISIDGEAGEKQLEENKLTDEKNQRKTKKIFIISHHSVRHVM